MFSCYGILDHASWNGVFHYWDTKHSCIVRVKVLMRKLTFHSQGKDSLIKIQIFVKYLENGGHSIGLICDDIILEDVV